MAKNTVLSRELKALQEELSASQRRHLSPAAEPASASGAAPVPSDQREDTVDVTELRDELREFVKEITDFVEDAEKNVSAHPTASVIGALVVGILIGRLLGRH